MPQQIIGELESILEALGPWANKVVLGGGVALIVYDEIMAPKAAGAVGTLDIDFLIPRKPVVETESDPISKLLQQKGFEYRGKSHTTQPPIESYVKDVNGSEIEIEFLTDAKIKGKPPTIAIKEAGLVAQSLSYIEMSLNSVTEAKLPGSTLARIVRPEAWLYHKGLTFPKRGDGSIKQLKDLYGIWFLSTQLATFSEATLTNLRTLQKQQPTNWQKTFNENLEGFCSAATPATWLKLEQQDPENRLRKTTFLDLAERLTASSD